MAAKLVAAPLWWCRLAAVTGSHEVQENGNHATCYEGKVCGQGEHIVRGLAHPGGRRRCPEDRGLGPWSLTGVGVNQEKLSRNWMLCAYQSEDHIEVNLNNPRHKLIRVEQEASLFKWGQADISHASNIRGPRSIVLGVEELVLSETQLLHTHLG